MTACVYMLRCSDGSYYVGSTRGDSPEKRVGEHQDGAYPGYTSRRRPVTLVWSERFDSISDAVLFERQLKGWSRAKKEALIRGDWDTVRAFAKRRGGNPAGLNPRPSRLPRPDATQPVGHSPKKKAVGAPQDED